MQTHGHTTLESMSQALWYNRWTMNKFSSFLTGDILEVGCGIGNFTPALARFGRVWAIDIDRDALARTKKQIADGVKVGFGDIEKGKYFFPKRKFDTLVCLNVLEHIQSDGDAIQNMHTLLHIGGHLILLVPIYKALYGTIDSAIGHYRRYAPTEILRLLTNSGYLIVSSRKLNFLGAIGWWLSGRVLRRSTVSKRRIWLFNRVAPWVLPVEDLIEPPFGTSILIVAKRS